MVNGTLFRLALAALITLAAAGTGLEAANAVLRRLGAA